MLDCNSKFYEHWLFHSEPKIPPFLPKPLLSAETETKTESSLEHLLVPAKSKKYLVLPSIEDKEMTISKIQKQNNKQTKKKTKFNRHRSSKIIFLTD